MRIELKDKIAIVTGSSSGIAHGLWLKMILTNP